MATAQRQLHVKLSAKDAASLRKIAREYHLTHSDVIRALIRHYRLEMKRRETP